MVAKITIDLEKLKAIAQIKNEYERFNAYAEFVVEIAEKALKKKIDRNKYKVDVTKISVSKTADALIQKILRDSSYLFYSLKVDPKLSNTKCVVCVDSLLVRGDRNGKLE